jgi:hypothetical protein
MFVASANTTDNPTPCADAFVLPKPLSTVATNDSEIASQNASDFQTASNRPYGKLARWTIDNISVIDQRIKASHSLHCIKLSCNEKFKLWAHQWRLNILGTHVGTCRMVLIQGSTNEIINTWVFPAVPSHDPVFAAELIAMAGSPRLTFIDIQTPAIQSDCHPIRNQTLALRKQFDSIRSDEIPPEWAIADSQGGYVFSRQLTADAFQAIQQCYKSYFLAYLGTLSSENTNREKQYENGDHKSLERLHAYQIHHRESSPGNVFLSKLFGVDWTKDFLEKFLFTLA